MSSRRDANFVERIQAGEIWARFTDEERRGEFVLFDRMVVSGNLNICCRFSTEYFKTFEFIIITTSTPAGVDVVMLVILLKNNNTC